jgi:transketolase
MSSENTNLHSIRQAFANTITDLAGKNLNLYVVSMDLKSSVGLTKFAKKFHSRFIECGVAENNAAGVAAGLAKSGKTVFLVSYACFSPGINWATIRQSICYNNLPVKIIGSHGGLMTGELGGSHQMLEDVALTRSLPNLEVFSPIDAVETSKLITTIANSPKPSYVRLVRPSTPVVFDSQFSFTIGQSHILKSGTDITVLGFGPILIPTLDINHPSLEIINCSSIKPLDSKTIINSVTKTGRCLVIEDHQQNGGLGEAVSHLLLSHNINCRFIHLAVDNQFGQSAHDYQTLFHHYHLDLDALKLAIKKIL